jgi:hypothetical protein
MRFRSVSAFLFWLFRREFSRSISAFRFSHLSIVATLAPAFGFRGYLSILSFAISQILV